MDYKSGNHMYVLYYYGRVEPEFYMIPVFYMTLSRTKWTFSRMSELYFMGSSYLQWEKFGPLGSCKIQFPLNIKLPGMKIALKIKKRRGEGKKRRGDRQKKRRGDGRRRRRRGDRQKKEERRWEEEERRWAEEEEEVVRSIFHYSLPSEGEDFLPSKEEGQIPESESMPWEGGIRWVWNGEMKRYVFRGHILMCFN